MLAFLKGFVRGVVDELPIAKSTGTLILSLALVCGSLWLWGRAGHAAADRWEAKALAERDNHRITKANFRAAQEQAAVAARAARLATEERSRQLAERADHAEDLADARTAAARFAAARRVPDRTGGAAASAPGSAGTSSEADLASAGDRPGADAVVLTRGEFDELVGNTIRLERVRRWGEQLITADLAVPAAQSRKDD